MTYREDIKGAILDYEYNANDLRHLACSYIKVKNIIVKKKVISADVILCVGEDGPITRYNGVEYTKEILQPYMEKNI